jgi:DNA topoisomerase VI subunit B
MSRLLHRELFETKRQLEYFSPKELSMQLGADPGSWGVVLIKELVDNALDACETAGIAPEIAITLSPDGFTVEDHGPGMSRELIERSLNYDIRVSDKMYYVSPSRGQLGNATKCLWAAPYTISPESPGHVEVESLGACHHIAATVHRIAQEPRLHHTITDLTICKNGAKITVTAPKLACYRPWSEIDDFYKSVEELIEKYAAFNPHASLTLEAPEWINTYPATTPGWTKWHPSHPTSPYWYEGEHLIALLAAYLNREWAGGRTRTMREFVAEFHGLSASANQKTTLEICNLQGRYLHDLVEGEDLREEDVARLLTTMQGMSRPVKPRALGVLGREHLEEVLRAQHQVDTENPRTFKYTKTVDDVDGLPYVLEVACGAVRTKDAQDRQRCLLTGINWSATPANPFQHVDDYLNTALVQEDDPVVVVVHLAIPRPTFRDRGKQALALPRAIESALKESVDSVTHHWTKAKRATFRSHRADARAIEELNKQERARYPSIKEAAYQLMPQAYRDASGQGRYVAHARQIMYAARPKLLAMIHPDQAAKGLKAQYFTQTLVPDYMTEHPAETADWDVVFDERGHFREPHLQNGRERIVGLGTLAVRQYIKSWQGNVRDTIAHIMLPFDVKTSGPEHRYQAVLFIEKEGFDELIQQAQIAERFDIAPMSTKGMSNTAARRLVDELSLMGVPIYVLHDFDKSGFSILHTLRTDTRRYRFKSTPKVEDLGLTLDDVLAMNLQSEPQNLRQRKDPRIDLARCGASPREQAFLITGDRRRNPQTNTYYWPGQRVELNAMTSDVFVEWIERRLTEKHVTKVIPTAGTLAKAYRLAVRTKAINTELARIQETLATEAVNCFLPDLVVEVQAEIAADPTLSWDAAVWKLVNDERFTSDDERCW